VRARGKIAVLLGGVCLALSLLLFHVTGEARQERVLFFPGTISKQLSGESRVVHYSGTPAEDMRTLVEELILGPVAIDNSRALSKETEIRLLIVRDEVLYLDLSYDLLYTGEEVNLNVKESLAAVRKTLHFNFPWLERVHITIGGNLPFEPPHLASHKDQI
jgi:hypothetical protein